jgi:archaellum biogenesis protein FlaJ (TadC family)
MTTSIVRFINIIVAALLAGVSFGIWIGFNPLKLSPSTYIEQQQNMLRALKVLMISLVIFAALITISSAFLQKNNKPAFISLLVAAVFFISCILITRFGIKPIDDKVMTWTVNSIPGDWTELRDKWWLLHKLRTFVELIALFLVTWTSIKRD